MAQALHVVKTRHFAKVAIWWLIKAMVTTIDKLLQKDEQLERLMSRRSAIWRFSDVRDDLDSVWKEESMQRLDLLMAATEVEIFDYLVRRAEQSDGELLAVQ